MSVGVGHVMGAATRDEALVAAALEIGAGLAATVVPSGAGSTWRAEIVVGIDEDAPVIGHGDVGASLYDGTAGIALGLAACATAAPPPVAAVLADAARGAARHALASGEELLETRSLGLFTGATGVALGAAGVGRALGDEDLLMRAAALAHAIAGAATATLGTAPAGDELDLIGGLAGTMLGLQGTMWTLGEPSPEALLIAGARRLAAAATPQLWGSAWPAEAGRPALLGFGHGSAGIALALGEAAAISSDPRDRLACAEGIEYERGWFDPDRVGWPDLRDARASDEPTAWMAAWCHGALGIGLSRLRLGRLSDDALLTAEASAALQAARDLVVGDGTALRGGRTSDCTACHGLGGVTELLLVAAQALGVPGHAHAARRVAALMLEQHEAAEGRWPCGLPGAGEVPGLMTGTAGIALTLLRASGATSIATPLLPGPSGW